MQEIKFAYRGKTFSIRKSDYGALIRVKSVNSRRFIVYSETDNLTAVSLAQSLFNHGARVERGYYLDFICA